MKNLGYVLIAALLSACGAKTMTTENGTVVNYIRKGDGSAPVDSLISMLRLEYTTEEGELMMDSEEPIPLKIDPNTEADQGELFSVLTLLKTGDSVHFELPAQELFEKTFRAPRPDSIAADSKIQFRIAFVEQLTEEGYYEMVANRAEAAAAKQIIIDNEILDKYLSDNGITAEKTESGLRYVIKDQGNGTLPQNGDTVLVDYLGKVLDGAYFDTSNEELAKENGLFNEQRKIQIGYNPFQVILGRGGVIKGWEEGLLFVPEGGKATLYIPSTLGYGSRGSGPIIKPNSILEFDVEVVEIK
ncbi:MAG: FKBP-type peptidyl-prolyl cis-trans isomerase [Ekhidna sp.]|nr:FKBP-type peptidyl-prolyl cis-trans isomerase [Ekhidna sp.]